MEENLEFTLDNDAIEEVAKVPTTSSVKTTENKPTKSKVLKAKRDIENKELINCLSKKKVTVLYIPRRGAINDPKHVMYGGLAESAAITLTVPRLRSGMYKNILTDAEKDYLESVMGLELGALSIYNKNNNFWENGTEGGISFVRLTKQDTILDLSSPIDYIKYKILLANTELVAPNQLVLQDRRKATYRFVLITEDETTNTAINKMNSKMRCYTEFGKIMDDKDTLRAVVETITSKPLDKNTSIDYLQTKANDLIEGNAKLFLNVVQDPLLKVKVLIQRCVEEGFISKRGDYYYLRDGESFTPLCDSGEDPVISNAARYLSNPKRLEMKFTLEAKLNRA